MIGLRRSLPVLAEVPTPQTGGSRPGALRGSELRALEGALDRLGDERSVLVTGEDGIKGPIASGLAAAALSAGRRAALLECDLVSPQLADALGLASSPGLHEYLRWDVESHEILQQLVLAGPRAQGTRQPLVCVVAGEPSGDGAALLSSESFAHAVAKLARAYDLLVIDGPPLGEPELASLAAAQADAALACVRRSQASGKPAKALAQAMRRLPGRSLGLIVRD